jgi:hypothetical protein
MVDRKHRRSSKDVPTREVFGYTAGRRSSCKKALVVPRLFDFLDAP